MDALFISTSILPKILIVCSIRNIKGMEYANGISWSEMVNMIGDNNSEVMSAFFSK